MDLNLDVAKKRFTEMFELGSETRDLEIVIDHGINTMEETMSVSYNGPLDNDWNEEFQKIINKFNWCSHSCKYNSTNGRVEMVLKRRHN